MTSDNEVKFHDDTVLVGGRGRVPYQANISGELKAGFSNLQQYLSNFYILTNFSIIILFHLYSTEEGLSY